MLILLLSSFYLYMTVISIYTSINIPAFPFGFFTYFDKS
ncbi:hypothetical protein BAME_15680 [Bacillus sp. M 2-6]|nr:hypothetical protein BAME_15680 [Bacillus sp. M 2-6]